MDNFIYASVRQIAATWYFFTKSQQYTHEAALQLSLTQAEIYLSDLGITGKAAEPYLVGARKVIKNVPVLIRNN